MKFESWDDLYIDELHDLYNAGNQILEALPKMIQSAPSVELRTALNELVRQTHEYMRRLQRVFQLHDEAGKGRKCPGVEGIENPDLRDTAVMAGAQKVEQYEMASYSAVRAWARQMGHAEAAELPQPTLDEQGEADKKLTQSAQKRNTQAARRAG